MGSGAKVGAGKPVWRLLVAQWLGSRNVLKDKLTGFPDALDWSERKKRRPDDAKVDFILEQFPKCSCVHFDKPWDMGRTSFHRWGL